jgi:DNA-3-methyladenine glycosylase I
MIMSPAVYELPRCAWVPLNDPLYVEYHDFEWGTPIHDDRLLFEFLVLEGAQAGLSWKTILHKRQGYRSAFHGFQPEIVSKYGETEIRMLMGNQAIVRNRMKINAAIITANAFLNVRDEFGTFDKYIWEFVKRSPLVNGWVSIKDVPAKTALSDQVSRDLLKRGFKFVGSTICYSFLQATGLINDHTTDCFRFAQLTQENPKDQSD